MQSYEDDCSPLCELIVRVVFSFLFIGMICRGFTTALDNIVENSYQRSILELINRSIELQKEKTDFIEKFPQKFALGCTKAGLLCDAKQYKSAGEMYSSIFEYYDAYIAYKKGFLFKEARRQLTLYHEWINYPIELRQRDLQKLDEEAEKHRLYLQESDHSIRLLHEEHLIQKKFPNKKGRSSGVRNKSSNLTLSMIVFTICIIQCTAECDSITHDYDQLDEEPPIFVQIMVGIFVRIGLTAVILRIVFKLFDIPL